MEPIKKRLSVYKECTCLVFQKLRYCYLINAFHLAVRVHSDNAPMASERGKNKVASEQIVYWGLVRDLFQARSASGERSEPRGD